MSMVLKLIVPMLAVGACSSQVRTPSTRVEVDEWPWGHGMAEGVACDLARSFIRADSSLMTASCLRPFGATTVQQRYIRLMAIMTNQLNEMAKASKPNPSAPQRIVKVFAFRQLSHKSAANAARSEYHFRNVGFVDIIAMLNNGHQAMNRTFVVQQADGKWYADPMPMATPKISLGLNEEPMSKVEIKGLYSKRKHP